MKIIDLYKKYIGSKLLVKLFIVYSFIILISLTYTSNLITNSFLDKAYRQEIEKNQILLYNVKSMLEEEYEKYSTILLQIYASPSMSNALIDSMEGNKIISESENIREYLNGIFAFDDAILDVIFIGEGNTSYYTSRTQSRSIVEKYDFEENTIYQTINTSKKIGTSVFYDQNPEYILNSQIECITFAGQVYDPNHFPNREVLGTFLMNISKDSISNLYSRDNITTSLLYVTNEDNVVIYSSDNQFLGSNFPYVTIDHESNNPEMMIDQVKLSGSDLTIHVITFMEDVEKLMDDLRRNVDVVLIISIVLTLLLNILVSSSFGKRVKDLKQTIEEIEIGNLDVVINTRSSDEIGQISQAFNTMSIRLKRYIEIAYEAELEHKKAEIATLQSKINPHFLYNTIECIRMKALTNQDQEVSEMLMMLGDIFRQSIADSEAIVSVDEALEFIDTYLNLHKVIYNDRLEIKYKFDDSAMSFGILRLLIQPVVENAMIHGIYPKKGGVIYIAVKTVSDKLQVEVIDNGAGINETRLLSLADNTEQEDHHIGLFNVRQRIELMYGREYGLRIDSKENRYTKVILELPLIDTV